MLNSWTTIMWSFSTLGTPIHFYNMSSVCISGIMHSSFWKRDRFAAECNCVMILIDIFSIGWWTMLEKGFSRYFSLDLKFVEIFCGFPVKKSKRSHCAKYSFLSISARKIEKIFESKILESMKSQFDFWRESSNTNCIIWAWKFK